MSDPWYIPDPQQRVEQVLLAYASSSLSASNLIDPGTEWFTGMANSDKEGTACVVECNNARETYLQTRVYAFDVDISTRQIAYDSTTDIALTSSFINFSGNIHSVFGDSTKTVSGINAMMAASEVNDFFVHQVQVMSYQSQRIEDTWISNLNLRVIGKLV